MTDTQPTSKRCTKCGRTKPIEDFFVSKRRPDGRTKWCKGCHAAKRDEGHDEPVYAAPAPPQQSEGMDSEARAVIAAGKRERKTAKVATWDQVGSLLRDMAETEAAIVAAEIQYCCMVIRQRANVDERLEELKRDQLRARGLIEPFVTLKAKDGGKAAYECDYGTVALQGKRLVLTLNAVQAARDRGKP